MLKRTLAALATVCVLSSGAFALPSWFASTEPTVEKALVQRYGENQHERITRGLTQAAELWRNEDGGPEVFSKFAQENFAGDQSTLDALFDRFQRHLEVLDGHLAEINYDFKLQVDVERGRILPFDNIFAGYDDTAHLSDDFFANKLAFVVLLNFPLTTLEQNLSQGAHWTRRQWAEVRLAHRFSARVPAAVEQGISDAERRAESYIDEYKIHAHHLLDPQGNRLFAPGTVLISHWNLRDEIKAQYSNANGLGAQRLLERVMERIVDQSIPESVINSSAVDWAPFSNAVSPATGKDGKPVVASASDAREPDTRYARLLEVFQANGKADPYYPAEPTLIARKFDLERQMTETRVRGMLEQVLGSPEFARAGKLIEKRLGRPLEPFDIWYNGFSPRGRYTEAELDAITRKRYPTADAYRADLPHILGVLGFSPAKAAYLQSMIDVEPSRGPGHAMPSSMRGQKARLRTRVEANGMNYKGFNIAVHEMGHNIEQTFSMNEIDYTLLHGVPNNAFTEALAMLTQGHDLEVLGLAAPDARSVDYKTVADFWDTIEICGVSLVDMGTWHWMYEHPNATPAELRAAVLQIARDTWNRWYAPVLGHKDCTLLAIYSHMIFTELYLPDYAIGRLVGYQMEAQMRKAGSFGGEFERMAKFGNLPPDLWMQNAAGQPVSAEALLKATAKAMDDLEKGS